MVSDIISSKYRDQFFIRKDIIFKLIEFGELNQTKLLTSCGLNLGKHRNILKSLVSAKIIEKTIIPRGTQKSVKYSITDFGMFVSNTILEPYENIFPRNMD